MPILRNQDRCMPEFLAKFYRRIETALGSSVMRRAPVPGSRCLGRSISAGSGLLPDQGPLPKHFCCGKWREMTSAILTK
jgi:hypothetical protein